MSENEAVLDDLDAFSGENDDILPPLPGKKSRKPPVRKGNNKHLAAEKKPSGKLPAALEEGTRAYAIAEMIKNGMSVQEIKTTYGLSKAAINQVMNEAVQSLQEDAAPIILNYVVITVTRLESMIALIFDKLLDNEGFPNDGTFERVQSLMRQQQEVIAILAPKKGDQGNRNVNIFSQTIIGGGTLYETAVRDINQKLLGGGVSDRETEISDLDDPFGSNGIIYPGD